MFLRFLLKIKWKPAVLIAVTGVFLCANVQAAGSGSSMPQTDASYGTPLSAGQMTLEDVLETHPLPKKPALQAPALLAGSYTSSPPLMDPAQASTENDMLMQGMKKDMQQSGADTSPLRAPQLPGAAIQQQAVYAPSGSSTIAQPSLAATSAIQYQPGQAPKNLAAETGLLNAAPKPTAAEQAFVSPETQSQSNATQASPPSQSTSGTSSGNCQPHSEKWTKSCTDAGYPDTFTGQIEGETRTVCPEGNLQDVWMSNSCAPPEAAAGTATALSAPSSAQLSPTSMLVSSGDGSCGAANGPAVNAKPATELCNSGEPSEVTGDGPWMWSCRGSSGGMTVSCAAAVGSSPPITSNTTPVDAASPESVVAAEEFENGHCGSANGVITDSAPVDDLCAKGNASPVNGNGPWTWACSGQGGGQAEACMAPKKMDGMCGSASSAVTDGMPTTDLCESGYASAVTGQGPWNWTCSGLYGGAPALCSAAPRQDAVCGTASTYSHREAPGDNLCSIGQPSSVNGGGPWTWSCSGINGGASVSCASPISVKGACGAANGMATASAPSDDLCAHGKPSHVTGNGPWSWSCSGTDGGDSESCTAPIGSEASTTTSQAESNPAASASTAASALGNGNEFVACGASADFAAFSAPAKDLCRKGQAGPVMGNGPWSWTCGDTAGHKTDCATLSPSGSFSEGLSSKSASASEMPAPLAAPASPVSSMEEKATCGAAAGQGTATAPSGYLCSFGKASAVHGNGPWDWTCEKGKGKDLTRVSCEAPKLQDASCGSANGSVQRSTPASNLCSGGTPTSVQGSGPWMWSCVGSGGGMSVSCSANSQADTRVDAACGSAAGSAPTAAPAANLCGSGIPSALYGYGPWTWTCSGLNGGAASVCSTQKKEISPQAKSGVPVNGLCGNANGIATNVQPQDGLCAAGNVTQITGNGPWNWSCRGTGSGSTVSCTAPLQSASSSGAACCGLAAGVPTSVLPTSGLCASGVSSAVSGRGPWTWSCSGINGKGSVACVAPLTGMADATSSSLIAPAAEAPVPQAAATSPVTSSNLSQQSQSSDSVTLSSASGALEMAPPSPFPPMPAPSSTPPVPPQDQPAQTPATTPDLPPGTQALQPPAVRDTIKPAAALTAPATGTASKAASSHLVLPDDLSVISFKPGAEAIDPSVLPTLDKLALVLQGDNSERITLTSYAGVGPDTSPRDARRLSLTRALAIRDYLTAKGITSARINVRALGANAPSGDPDRVDIKAE